MSCIRQVSLIVNCGYARVCIYENSNPGSKGARARQDIDKPKRLNSFRSQFGPHPQYKIPDGYFEVNGKGTTQFDRDCNKILDSFVKYRNVDIQFTKNSYLMNFSSSKWSKLPIAEKAQHTLGNCKRCFELHPEHQAAFPLKPQYIDKPVVTLDYDALQRQGIKKFTSNVLSELNRVYTSKASTSFTDAVTTTKSSGLEKKKTPNEKRKAKICLEKQIVSKVNQHFADTAAIAMLTEGESKRKYHRKRLLQSYSSPADQRKPKKKKHSPNFEHVSWDTQQLQSTLENWPAGTAINWSAVGREHGIEGKNAGQIAREFAEARELDVEEIMSSTPKRKPTNRPCKRKLPGTNVSIPSNPPIHAIEAEIKSMITSGRFTLGEECAPFKITKYVMENDTLAPRDTLVQARKVPLKQLRQRLLKKHQKYMRLTPARDMGEQKVRAILEKANYTNLDAMTHEEQCEALDHAQTSRALCFWHDHATILKMGFIMITVHVMYDSLVFLTDDEYHSDINIQSEVEQPEVYILSAGSSSGEDQAALVGERITCLLDLPTPVQTDSGMAITDTVRFFTGDHPAAQYEQGSKHGGYYKCGACGCHEALFSDQAHALTHVWRPLEELQSLAIGGTLGLQPGEIRPFHELKVNELKIELGARGVHLEDGLLKKDLQGKLDGILRGVASVPALLLPNPT